MRRVPAGATAPGAAALAAEAGVLRPGHAAVWHPKRTSSSGFERPFDRLWKRKVEAHLPAPCARYLKPTFNPPSAMIALSTGIMSSSIPCLNYIYIYIYIKEKHKLERYVKKP